ncbi:hypothetical protein HMPREF0758_2174 [Serratia odorifera DSM 4582]|uniref:Uncharacterized protein n=1 Tax=Serratia odorifera DSM 4582 TaxID=667129 RepID=D4E1X4_SEROD|nr:hypothetical protein HMPREF0758_2174 [Serratia odorifera DSM 4582]
MAATSVLPDRIRSSQSMLRVIHAGDITVAQITTSFNRLRLFGIMPSSPCLAAGKRRV